MLPAAAALAQPDAAETAWKEVRTRHVIVRHVDNARLAQDVSRAAERDYDRIARELGITRYDRFWVWQDRAVVWLHPSREHFRRATNAPEWATARSQHEQRRIDTYEQAPGLLSEALPHELAHIVFSEFVGDESQVPLWLHEGVAQWAQLERRRLAPEQVAALRRQGRLLPLRRLTAADVRTEENAPAAAAFYAQAVALIRFMIERYGPRRFRAFCGQLRDGKSVDDALRFAYPREIRNIEDLEEAWLKAMEGG
jgi:hypothetical protein